MLAEQQEQRRGWSRIRGLALCVVVCPWDASLLEKWSQCVRCTRSRRLLAFTAHCLRAPALHEKYQVHNVLQVVLIVPQENNPKSAEIANMLAKNAIKRGSDVGFPLIRFDATSDSMAKILEELKLKKEWQLSYDILYDNLKETKKKSNGNETNNFDKTEEISHTKKAEDSPIDVKAESLSNTETTEDYSRNTHSPAASKESAPSEKKPKSPSFKHHISVYTALINPNK